MGDSPLLSDATPAVSRALELAGGWAHVAGRSRVGVADVVHALLAEEEGRAAGLCRAAGLDYARYRAVCPVPPADLSGTDLQADAALLTALREARNLAHEMSGERTVASEALLLALVRADDGSRHDLSAHGFDAALLEAEVLKLIPPPLPLDEPLLLAEPTERHDTLRVLDAAANRAREGLRVAEDYCRFVLDDPLLTRELKELRHGLTAALGVIEPPDLLAARDTEADVGTTISTLAERQRSLLSSVVQANLKRAQEALRSLEEFGKVIAPEVGEAVERLRYRTYTLERALLRGGTGRERLADVRLCVLLTGSQCSLGLERTLREAVAGGADMVQLREKEVSDRDLLERARQVRRWTRELGVVFVVNDRPDVARLVEADGVHLGQDDLPLKEARRILGPDTLIGVSTHDVEQVRRAVLAGASYLGVGPTFPSCTKQFAELAGLEFVRQVSVETSLPWFAIGGVNVKTIGDVVAAGAMRVAVSAAVAGADAPQAAARALRQALDA